MRVLVDRFAADAERAAQCGLRFPCAGPLPQLVHLIAAAVGATLLGQSDALTLAVLTQLPGDVLIQGARWPRVAKPVSYGDELTPAAGSFITSRTRASPSSGTLRYRVARLTPRTWATSVTGVFSPIIFRACFNFAGLGWNRGHENRRRSP